MRIQAFNIALREDSEVKLPPVGLAYVLTSLKEADIDFDLLDLELNKLSLSELEEYIKACKADIYLMGTIVTGFKKVHWIQKTIKKYHPKSIIIVGNSVGSSIVNVIYESTLIDYIVKGEGDITDVELLRALINNEPVEDVLGVYYRGDKGMVYTGNRPEIKNLDDLPFIDWSIFDIETYIKSSVQYIKEPYPMPLQDIRALPINSARGCPYRCTFCHHEFKDCKYRNRSIDNILDEYLLLQKKYNVNYINFFDELTFFTLDQVRSWIEAFSRRKIKMFWTASCRAGLFTEKDLDTVKELKAIGCIGLGYSLESSDPDILKAMNKKIKTSDFIQQTEVLQKSGIATWTSLVIGYPMETKATIKNTLKVCSDSNVYPSVGFLLPLPNTEIYRYAKEKNLIGDETEYVMGLGDRQDFNTNLTQLTRAEIENTVRDELLKIRDRLQISLEDSQLIKTKKYRYKAR